MHARVDTHMQTDWVDALEQEAHMLVEELDTHPVARQLFNGSIDVGSYAHYLVQTYHYVRWTTPLLAEAGQRMKSLGRPGPLAELLLQKASEERGHERWLLSDLKNLGWSAERVAGEACCPAVSAYISWNRYTTLSAVPAAFLGTAYVLEYLAAQRASRSVESLLLAGSIPNIHKAVTFLSGHGRADGNHVAELASVLRSLEGREEQQALLLSARTTRVLYVGLFPVSMGQHLARTP